MLCKSCLVAYRTNISGSYIKPTCSQWSEVVRRQRAARLGTSRILQRESHNVTKGQVRPTRERRNFHSARQLKSTVPRLGTVAACSEHTSIEQLVDQIKPQIRSLRREKINDGASPSILALLVTPAYAKYALSSQFPLSILERLGENDSVQAPVDAITAVVDRLPSPANQREGIEGLSYLFTTAPGSLDATSRTAVQRDAQKPGSLSFELSIEPSTGLATTVQLPLASTIFSTGLTSTLTHSHYKPDAESGRLQLSTTERLESLTIRVPVSGISNEPSLSVPLIPLTPARTIKNSMGNIVRKLSSNALQYDLKSPPNPLHGPESEILLTASQELETAVSQYFVASNLQPEPVQVWALIVPSDLLMHPASHIRSLLELDGPSIREQWSLSLNSPTPSTIIHQHQHSFMDLLIGGSRFCKVLSGGGGWGKKAGLISLDPDAQYSTRNLRQDTGWEFVFDQEDPVADFAQHQKQALGDIVREGEIIMFFLAPKGTEVEQNRGGAGNGIDDYSQAVLGSDLTVTFGAMPSRIDEIPEPVSHIKEPSKHPSTLAKSHANIFGMLSEGGMAAQIARDGNIVCQTKLDFPYSRISVSSAATRVRTYSTRADKPYSSTQQHSGRIGNPDRPDLPLANAADATFANLASERLSNLPPLVQSVREDYSPIIRHQLSRSNRGNALQSWAQQPEITLEEKQHHASKSTKLRLENRNEQSATGGSTNSAPRISIHVSSSEHMARKQRPEEKRSEKRLLVGNRPKRLGPLIRTFAVAENRKDDARELVDRPSAILSDRGQRERNKIRAQRQYLWMTGLQPSRGPIMGSPRIGPSLSTTAKKQLSPSVGTRSMIRHYKIREGHPTGGPENMRRLAQHRFLRRNKPLQISDAVRTMPSRRFPSGGRPGAAWLEWSRRAMTAARRQDGIRRDRAGGQIWNMMQLERHDGRDEVTSVHPDSSLLTKRGRRLHLIKAVEDYARSGGRGDIRG